MEAGLRIAKARERKGLTQAELQRRCRFESPRLHKYETGKSYPDPPAWRALATALETTIDALMGAPVPDVEMTDGERELVAAELPPSAPSAEVELVLRGIRRALIAATVPGGASGDDVEVRAVRAAAEQEWSEAGGGVVRDSQPPAPATKKKPRG